MGTDEVQLEWYNPPSRGIKPEKYRILMRNETRNYSKWSEVYYPGDITTTRFLVRNLPFGIPCQFKVAAWNRGGWSEYSPSTPLVVPGEEEEALPDDIRWRRLQQGGPLAISDRLDAFPKNRQEQLTGLRYLISFAQNSTGFPHSNVALRAANIALRNLQIYENDPEIAGSCFHLMGWCLKGLKAERKVRNLFMQNDVVMLVHHYITEFRSNTRIMGSVAWLRSSMMKYLPIDPENDYSTLMKMLDSPDEEEFSEDEEEEDEAEAKAMELVLGQN